MLRGNHPARVDTKGRLKIPAAHLARLLEFGTQFFVTSENGERALIFPMKEWESIEQKLMQVASHHLSRQKFLTRTSYYGQEVSIDKQGRLLIPAVLRVDAGITGDVDVIGHLTRLEVWNHDRFLEHMKKNELTEDDAKSLADLGL
jgi:MraZ protein